MPNPKPVDYSGKQIGPFTVIERAERARHWRVRCTNGHVAERRIDRLLQPRPESLHCAECRRSKPLNDAEMTAAFTNFVSTLGNIQRAALRKLLVTFE